MGQVFAREHSFIPYDVNAWRRLSLTYLNQLNENGELIVDENGVPIDPKNLPRSRPPSRQSSISSRHDPGESRHSFRVAHFPGEQPVLQEYQPKNKTTSSSSPGSNRGQGSDRPPYVHLEDADGRRRRNDHDPIGLNGSHGTNSGHYADLAFPNRGNGSQSSSGDRASNKNSTNDPNRINGKGLTANPTRVAPPPPGGRNSRVEHERQQGSGPAENRDLNDGSHHHRQNGSASHCPPGFHNPNSHNEHSEYPPRAQSPKSVTTWNSSSDYTSSTITDPHWKQYETNNQHHNQNGQSFGKSGKYLAPPSGGHFGSRQSSGRSGKSSHYIPYRDYYIDRKLRGEEGPNSYSDFSGYSRNSLQRGRTQICCTKWLFVVFALLNIASTIWNSIYMQMMSKNMELGFPIQDKRYSMSDAQRHIWEGFIITAQVINNLVNILAIYGALVERYWLIWTYTLLMFLYAMFGAVSVLTRGSYTSWVLPLICGQLAIVLTHQIAIKRQHRKYR